MDSIVDQKRLYTRKQKKRESIMKFLMYRNMFNKRVKHSLLDYILIPEDIIRIIIEYSDPRLLHDLHYRLFH